MSEKKLSEEIIKSLAEELDLSEDEIRNLLKSEESETPEVDEKEGSEEEEDEGKVDEKVKKSEEVDLTTMSDDDLKKSTSLYVQELNKRALLAAPEKEVGKPLTVDDLQKSVFAELGEFKDQLNKSLTESIEDLSQKVEAISKSVEAIGENSKGLKGMRFDFIEKAGDNQPFEKDGKTYLSVKDRDGISESMFNVIEKSENDDDKAAMSIALINYQGSGELSERGVKLLNKNGVYFKEQMKS